MTTIVCAHPLENSLNAMIRNTLVESLHNNKQPYHVINLFQDGFQPAMTPDELRTFFTGTRESSDPVVKKYQDALRETDHLVFIFPVWFQGEPSIVKSFFERTCLPGFGYAYTESGTKPLLTHIQKLTVLTTSGAPSEVMEKYFGNIIQGHFINTLVCNMIGPVDGKDSAWLNLGGARSPSGEELDGFIARAKARIAGGEKAIWTWTNL